MNMISNLQMGKMVMNPVLLVRKLRLTEVKSLAHSQFFSSFIKERHYTFI